MGNDSVVKRQNVVLQLFLYKLKKFFFLVFFFLLLFYLVSSKIWMKPPVTTNKITKKFFCGYKTVSPFFLELAKMSCWSRKSRSSKDINLFDR